MEIDWDNQFTQTGRIQFIAARETVEMETSDPSGSGLVSGTGDNSGTGNKPIRI